MALCRPSLTAVHTAEAVTKTTFPPVNAGAAFTAGAVASVGAGPTGMPSGGLPLTVSVKGHTHVLPR